VECFSFGEKSTIALNKYPDGKISVFKDNSEEAKTIGQIAETLI